MKKGFTDITVVLDESGSMSSIRSATLEALNSYFKSQWEQPGEVAITVVPFSFIVKESIRVSKGEEFNKYRPDGGTALLDAIGVAIDTKGEEYSLLPEDERPEHVIIVIQTDGEENASQSYKLSQIKEMIQHQTDVYKWNFVFLGANQDAIQSGESMGFAAGASLSYAASAKGMEATSEILRTYTSNVRSGAVGVSFSAEDREKAMASGK